jgi:hypothetical protein
MAPAVASEAWTCAKWQAVEELGQRIAEAIAIELLDQAERDRRLAAALAGPPT